MHFPLLPVAFCILLEVTNAAPIEPSGLVVGTSHQCPGGAGDCTLAYEPLALGFEEPLRTVSQELITHLENFVPFHEGFAEVKRELQQWLHADSVYNGAFSTAPREEISNGYDRSKKGYYKLINSDQTTAPGDIRIQMREALGHFQIIYIGSLRKTTQTQGNVQFAGSHGPLMVSDLHVLLATEILSTIPRTTGVQLLISQRYHIEEGTTLNHGQRGLGDPAPVSLAEAETIFGEYGEIVNMIMGALMDDSKRPPITRHDGRREKLLRALKYAQVLHMCSKPVAVIH